MTKTSSTVTMRKRQFASEVTSTSPTVAALIKRSVPSSGREWLGERGVWLIFSTRVPTLLAAFDAAGIQVEIVDTTGGGT